MAPLALVAPTLSASCTATLLTRSNWPLTDVSLRRPVTASRIARWPVGPALTAVPTPEAWALSENCRRSIPVRRSTPSRPSTRSVTITELPSTTTL
ncbi:hypothetical protein D3C81_1046770 [compost metagenome]